MNKRNKIILIATIIVLVIAGIAGIIYLLNYYKNDSASESNENISKIAKLYNELIEKKEYTYTATPNSDNYKQLYAKKDDNVAYIDTIYEGNELKFLIKDGNSYLLKDTDKSYFIYPNNQTDLNKVTDVLLILKDDEHTDGEEEISGKKYKYEEYSQTTNLAIKEIEDVENNGKTRFYFDKDKLVYIKTIIGNYSELLKIEINYKIDNNLFEIPSDYTQF